MIAIARALIWACAWAAGFIIMGAIAAVVSPASWWISNTIKENFGAVGLIAFLVGGFSFLIYINIQGRNNDDRKQVAQTGTLDIQRNINNLSRAERWRTLAVLLTPVAILAVILTVYLLTKAPT